MITVVKVVESKVSAEGRVSIPADIRYALGLEAGDRVQFVLEGGAVRLMTARAMAESVWARNTGGDAVDAGAVVRVTRELEAARTDDGDDRPADANASPGEDEFLAELFPAT